MSGSVKFPSQHPWRRARVLLPLLPALLFLCVFFLIPLAQVVLLSLQGAPWPLGHYGHIFDDPVQLKVLGNTLKLSLGVAAITLVAGYPVAFLLVKATSRLRRVLILLILASVWMSILVRNYAWMVLLGRQGPVNALLQAIGLISEPLPLLYNSFSVYVGMVHIMLPFMILPLYSVLQGIDLKLMDNARSLGAGPFISFLLVLFPLSLPGILAGTLLVFVISIGFFITPALLGGIENTTFVMLIEQEVSRFLNWELAAAMAIILLLSTLVLVSVYQYLLSAGSDTGRTALSPPVRLVNHALIAVVRLKTYLTFSPRSELMNQAATRLAQLGGWMVGSLTRIFPWLVMLFLLAPVLIIFPLSFSASPFLEFPPSGFSLRWFETVFGRADWINPILTSSRIAFAVVIVATTLGVIAAIPLVRVDFRGKNLILGFLLSPVIVPVIILAVSMHFFTKQIGIAGTLQALVIGHVVLALPFVIIVMSNALKSVDESLERVARTLGATPFVAFSRITMVLVRPAILTSGLFAFLVSFDDLVIALFLAGPTTKTLPKRLWEAIREEIDPTTAAVAVLITLISLAALLITEMAREKAVESSEPDRGKRRVRILELRRRGLFR